MFSKDLFQESKKFIPGGVSSPVRAFEPYPFFVKKASGSKIYDVDGNRYIDHCLAYGPLILGHADPNSLNYYLFADMTHLRECALSITDFLVNEEVFQV